MKRTLIKCGRLISMDDGIGDRVNVDIMVAGDRIEAVDAGLPAAADEVIDASGMIVMPGLINMHLHTFQAGFRAVGSEWLGPDYFRIFYGDIATRFQPEDNYLGTLFGALNQLNSGVTTLLDYSHNIRSLAQAERSVDALIDCGIRALYIHGDGLREPARHLQRALAYGDGPWPIAQDPAQPDLMQQRVHARIHLHRKCRRRRHFVCPITVFSSHQRPAHCACRALSHSGAL